MNGEIDELDTRAGSVPTSLYPGDSASRELIRADPVGTAIHVSLVNLEVCYPDATVVGFKTDYEIQVEREAEQAKVPKVEEQEEVERRSPPQGVEREDVATDLSRRFSMSRIAPDPVPAPSECTFE